jgi:hypothetical protein
VERQLLGDGPTDALGGSGDDGVLAAQIEQTAFGD